MMMQQGEQMAVNKVKGTLGAHPGYFDHSLPSDRARTVGMLRTHITAALAEEGGEVYVAESDATNEILGVATWHGPGNEFLST